MIRHHFLRHDLPRVLVGDLLQQFAQPPGHPPTQSPTPILRAPHHVQAQRRHPSRCAAKPALRHSAHPTKRHRQTVRSHAGHLPRFPRRLKPPVPSGRTDGSGRNRCHRSATRSSRKPSRAPGGTIAAPPAGPRAAIRPVGPLDVYRHVGVVSPEGGQRRNELVVTQVGAAQLQAPLEIGGTSRACTPLRGHREESTFQAQRYLPVVATRAEGQFLSPAMAASTTPRASASAPRRRASVAAS